MSSRITRLESASVRVSDHTTWTLLRLTDDAGRTGLGECSDGAPPAELERLLVNAWQQLAGTEPDDKPAQRPEGLAATTISGAIEVACLDLIGKREGQPIWKLLGGSDPGPIPIYANINRAPGPRTPKRFAETASRAIEDGFRAVKCAPFDHPEDEGLRIVEAIRAAIGRGPQLMVDLHHRLDPDRLDQLLPDLERLDLAWLEDAVGLDQPEQLRQLSGRTSIQMAGGEMCSDPVELEPSLGRGGLHVVLPDVKHAGGLRQAQRLAALAAAHGASVSPHNPTSPVGTAASLHLAGLVPNLLNLEFAYGETEWRPRTTVPTEEPRAGTLRVPTGPGLGITTNEDLIHFQAIGGKR